MNYLLTYSPTGGTKRVADVLAKDLFDSCSPVEFCCQKWQQMALKFQPEDVCLIAVPSFAGRVPAPAAEYLARLAGNGARAVLLCVYGNRAYEDTLIELSDILSERDFRVVAGAAAIAEHSIMRQYAAGRPDVQDLAALAKIAAEIKAKLASGATKACVLPGNRPYRQAGKMPFNPAANEQCTQCGLCSEACPMEAISMQSVHTCDAEKCINCMKCVAVCPAGARQMPLAILAQVAEKMQPLFATRKEPEVFV